MSHTCVAELLWGGGAGAASFAIGELCIVQLGWRGVRAASIPRLVLRTHLLDAGMSDTGMGCTRRSITLACSKEGCARHCPTACIFAIDPDIVGHRASFFAGALVDARLVKHRSLAFRG